MSEPIGQETLPTLEADESPTLYRVDSSRATFAELWRDVRSPLVLIVWLTKLLRVKLPGSINDPNVEALEPFEIEVAEIPENVRATMEPLLAELARLGFMPATFWAIADPLHLSRLDRATLVRADGNAIARVNMRVEGRVKPKTHLFVDFLTEFADGSFVWSTSARAYLNAPATMKLNPQPNAKAGDLWASHQALVKQQRPAIVRVMTADASVAMEERHHAEVRDFHLARKLFAPMTEAETKQSDQLQQYGAVKNEHGDVLVELDKLQNKSTSWTSAILLLGVSLMLFIGAGTARWDMRFLWILLPILFFHELGHYLAMKVFRYRNLRMFFIPLFGAAVSGQHYTAPAWKKVIVALMGPLPGILVGGVLGIAGLITKRPIFIEIGLLALILNGLNLLPVFPLDGGRVAHALFFSRHYILDIGFRVVAAIVLIICGAKVSDKMLLYLGIFMLVGVPAAFRIARIAADLRREGVVPPANDDGNIPTDVAQRIIERLRGGSKRKVAAKITAQQTLTVYETIVSRPPGWLATIAFTVVHLGAIVIAVGLLAVLFVGRTGSFRTIMDRARVMPTHAVDPAAMYAYEGSPGVKPSADKTIVASFKSASAADAAFKSIRPKLPEGAAMEVFGHSVILAFADLTPDQRGQWVDDLEAKTTEVLAQTGKRRVTMRFQCIAPDADAAKAIADELDDYASVPWTAHLIAPWSPDDHRPVETKEKQTIARRTYAKVQESRWGNIDSPEWKSLSEKIQKAVRRGDDEQVAKLNAEQQALMKKLGMEAVKSLRTKPATEINPQVVDLYLAGTSNLEKYIVDWPELLKMGALMGQLSLAGTRPAEAGDRYSAIGGANDQELFVTGNLTFIDAYHGPPALAKWLAAKRCIQITYEFYPGSFQPDAAEDFDDY